MKMTDPINEHVPKTAELPLATVYVHDVNIPLLRQQRNDLLQMEDSRDLSGYYNMTETDGLLDDKSPVIHDHRHGCSHTS